MTEVGSSTASAAEPSGRITRGVDTSEYSQVSFASTLTEDRDDDFPAPLLPQLSIANPISSTWIETDSNVRSPPRSIKPVGSSNTAHKGKQPSNGHIDPEHHKSGSSLSTIDETSAAGASSYAHPAPHHSSINGYLREDDSRRYREHVRIDSSDVDEVPYSPTTYPPTSEEDSEAKRVQQNLERWAAEERQRRKAQRSSKILTNRNSTVSSGGGLAHRLSILRPGGFSSNTNNLGAGPSSERLADGPSANPSIPYSSHVGDRPRDLAARRGSASSSAGGARGLHQSSSSSSFDSSQSHGSMVSDEHRPNKQLPPIGSRVSSTNHASKMSGGSAGSLKGAGHRDNGGERDPFRDPSENDASISVSHKRASLKPTPTAARPIVTVGRASSIQRRALESSYNSKGKGKGRSMPTIVATDTEAEAEAETKELSSRLNGMKCADPGENPFASSEDAQRSKAATSTTIHQGGLDEEVAMELAGRDANGLDSNGDIGESTLDTDSGIRPLAARTSTSSSKFRELGISEDDDWIESVGRSMGKERGRKMRIAQQADSTSEREEARKPWWTELFCGCSRDYDDDEQAGRTNPME